MQAGYDTGLSVTDASSNKYHCNILPIFALKERGLGFFKTVCMDSCIPGHCVTEVAHHLVIHIAYLPVAILPAKLKP